MGQHDRRIGLANDGGDLSEQFDGVEDFEVAGDRRMKAGAEQAGGLAGFVEADARGGRGVHHHAAAVAFGEIEIVNLESGRPQPNECPGHHVLDVIRMGGDGESRGHRKMSEGRRRKSEGRERAVSEMRD